MRILLYKKLVKDLKQTLGIQSVTHFTALKIAVFNAKKLGHPCWMSNESTWFKGKCMQFYSCFDNCRRLAYKISAYEVCLICPKLIAACKIHRKSPSRWPNALTMLDWFTIHEATPLAYIRVSSYVRSHVGCERVHQNLTYQARSTPKIIGILTKVFCTSGPNLVILAWTGDELSRGQAQNGVNFDFEVKFDLEDQGQSPPPKKNKKKQ